MQISLWSSPSCSLSQLIVVLNSFTPQHHILVAAGRKLKITFLDGAGRDLLPVGAFSPCGDLVRIDLPRASHCHLSAIQNSGRDVRFVRLELYGSLDAPVYGL